MSEAKTLTGKFTVVSPAPVASMYALDEYLYVGSGENGYLYRTIDGVSFEEFWRTGEIAVTSISEFGNALFIGTALGGKIMLHNFNTGNRFHYITTGDYEVSAMTTFNGLLYAATSPGGMVLSFDGDKWRKVYEAHGSGIRSMTVWNDRLHLFVEGTQSIPYLDTDGAWHFLEDTSGLLSISGTSPATTSLESLAIPNVFDYGFTYSTAFNGKLMFVGGEQKKLYSFDGTTVKVEFQSTTGDISGLATAGTMQLYISAGNTLYVHQTELYDDGSSNDSSEEDGNG